MLLGKNWRCSLAAVTVCLAIVACKTETTEKPVSGYLEIDGDKVYYESLGEGPAVVLIHGGFVDRRMWDEQLDPLAEHHRVIRYDLRGFGNSTMPDTTYSAVADLLQLLDHLQVEKARLVGLSMGGVVALDFTLEHPERVEALVMVASAPYGMVVPQEDSDRIMALFKTAQEKSVAEAVELWLNHPMLAATREDQAALERMRSMSTENGNFFLLKFWPMVPAAPPAVRRLHEIKAPTLIVAGDRDTPLNQAASDTLAAGIAGSRKVVIAGADHMVNLVKPAEFNHIVLDFLNKL